MLGSYGENHEAELAAFDEQMTQNFFSSFKRCQLVFEQGEQRTAFVQVSQIEQPLRTFEFASAGQVLLDHLVEDKTTG